MQYEILNEQGEVVNRISATAEYMQANYPEGSYNLIDTPIEPTVVPKAISMRQARRALFSAGLLASVEAAIQALPEPPKTEAIIEWEYSNEVQRYNGFVSQIAPLLSLTEQDLDNLFIAGAAL